MHLFASRSLEIWCNHLQLPGYSKALLSLLSHMTRSLFEIKNSG